MKWLRIVTIGLVVAACMVGAGSIWLWDQAPRWALALSGILAIPVILAAAAAALLAWYFIVEIVRPSVRLRKPLAPLSLATQEPALSGRRRYRMHPVTFWGVLTLGNRFALGFMVFGKMHHISFKEDEDA